MKIAPRIRRYNPGEESILFNVYYTSVHQLATREYSQEQIQAWAPRDRDASLWEERIRGINPFVAELNGELVGYSDLQPSGYIDHFFVSGSHARCGIGTALMNHILQEAMSTGLHELTSDVSRTAQPFYEKFGFTVIEQRQPKVRGVVIPNAFMRLRIV
ncbi:GNAT family N-acetyltransferase [Paucibacter sp. KBW04]|uniref:GNAT family N-acetyltransferase n=1 Tax=Paucibacter sp. KBW04 TaxID=2153361 RepID=UPI000F5722F9|nr:GNAT family N-acetyltransferase [Paucibacter sp. KBW04]RQO60471.1 GNAT family N-acetyltransferase [Paucibacter sp. KBW04]